MASLHEHLALPSVVASVSGVGSPLSVERVEDEIVVVEVDADDDDVGRMLELEDSVAARSAFAFDSWHRSIVVAVSRKLLVLPVGVS